MNPSRWQQLQQLFDAALARPESERDAFIDEACAGDASLREQLQALLRRHAQDDAAMHAVLGAAAVRAVRAQAEAPLGRRLGPWRLVAHLADGGMGAVYLGERADGEYQQQVAIKVLNPAFAGEQARARFGAERQLLARLVHPHIARLLDGGHEDDGAPFIVMEYVDGEPIDRWCELRRADLPTRLRLMIKVCRAVDHAHRNLIVHRDLKPGNILVDREGEPHLLDFGIAKLLEPQASPAPTSQALTPSHASPEQITGAPVTIGTDVYALGVLLYGLLTGSSPYGRETTPPAELARRIVDVMPEPPSRAAPALARVLRGDLDNIVLTALRKEPERRYPTAAALADDLERHLANRPVLARPDRWTYRSAKFVRRHPVAAPATALALLLALAGTASFTWRLAEERDRARAAERAAQAAGERASRAARFTASLLEGTGAAHDGTPRVSVRELLDRATGRVADELADTPEVTTHMHLALGSAYHSWGAYEQALPLLRAALAESTGRGPAGRQQRAEALSLLGTVTHDLRQLEVSLDWARQAEAAWREVGDPARHASALNDLALSLNALRRRTEAEPAFRDALARLREAHPAGHSDIAWTLNNLAWGLHAMGRLDEAAPLYAEALAMQRRIGAPKTDITQTLNNLAGLSFDRGDLDEAERRWVEVLGLIEQIYGPQGHAATVRALSMPALVDIVRGRFVEASARTAQALALADRLLGPAHPWTVSTRIRHAQVRLGLGDPAGARQLLAAARRQQRETPSDLSSRALTLHLVSAQLELHDGRAAAAESQARAALSIIDALPSPDRVPLDDLETALAHALARQGRTAEARLVATRIAERTARTLPPGHWRRLVAQVRPELPPFADEVDPATLARGRATLADLTRLTGPQAPVVRELERALARAAD